MIVGIDFVRAGSSSSTATGYTMKREKGGNRGMVVVNRKHILLVARGILIKYRLPQHVRGEAADWKWQHSAVSLTLCVFLVKC